MKKSMIKQAFQEVLLKFHNQSLTPQETIDFAPAEQTLMLTDGLGIDTPVASSPLDPGELARRL